MPAALAAAMFPSTSAPSSVARRRLMIDAYPIFLISGIALELIAPAHATVDSILAKFRMPGTSCLTTCALAAVAIRHATVNSASPGTIGCMRHLLSQTSAAYAVPRGSATDSWLGQREIHRHGEDAFERQRV